MISTNRLRSELAAVRRDIPEPPEIVQRIRHSGERLAAGIADMPEPTDDDGREARKFFTDFSRWLCQVSTVSEAEHAAREIEAIAELARPRRASQDALSKATT
jgi:hypothetical protein